MCNLALMSPLFWSNRSFLGRTICFEVFLDHLCGHLSSYSIYFVTRFILKNNQLSQMEHNQKVSFWFILRDGTKRTFWWRPLFLLSPTWRYTHSLSSPFQEVQIFLSTRLTVCKYFPKIQYSKHALVSRHLGPIWIIQLDSLFSQWNTILKMSMLKNRSLLIFILIKLWLLQECKQVLFLLFANLAVFLHVPLDRPSDWFQ